MPMSQLELFGRVQDFGYAQADPLRVVASRHHFRIWKTPFTAGGETVWAGAGTHDIGFDKDNRITVLRIRSTLLPMASAITSAKVLNKPA